MGLLKKIEQVVSAESLLAHSVIFILYSVLLFKYFPYGVFLLLPFHYWRSNLIKQKHALIKKEQEKERRKYAHERHQRWLETPLWKRQGFSSEEAYLANKEKIIRKREQDRFLAHSYKQRQKLAKLKKNLSSIEDLLKLSPIEFEKWVKVHIFEKEGWKAVETKVTGDGGIDLLLDRKTEHSIAQCKRFKKTVGEPLIRDFYGTMISEGVSKGYFITTGLFSLSALKFTEDKPIVMIDRRVLAQEYL